MEKLKCERCGKEMRHTKTGWWICKDCKRSYWIPVKKTKESES